MTNNSRNQHSKQIVIPRIKRADRWIMLLLALGCFGLIATSAINNSFLARSESLPAAPSQATAHSPNPKFVTKELLLPGATGLVTLDYFAWDRSTDKLWVPAGNLGRVDVIDGKTDEITRITGFQTKEIELKGRKVVIGPTSVTIGKGVVYVGNRADSSICMIDAKTTKLGDCIQIASLSDGIAAAPDGVVYVAPTEELWVTRGAPPIGIPSPDQSITILDASSSKLKLKTKIPLGGSAEGYAVDERRGLFYTNLEETKQTIAVDVHQRKIVSRWQSGCDEARGLALDKARQLLFVACSDRVVSMNVGGNGQLVGSISTGDGLDNIDYSETQRTLYAAASKAASLTIAEVNDRGNLNSLAVVPTTMGARGVVAGKNGTAYVTDPVRGRILKVTPH
jgi:DNA-binding beta-propeller fold protein YncE